MKTLKISFDNTFKYHIVFYCVLGFFFEIPCMDRRAYKIFFKSVQVLVVLLTYLEKKSHISPVYPFNEVITF